MCIESLPVTNKSKLNEREIDRSAKQSTAQQVDMDAGVNDGLRISRVAGGYMVKYPPLFSSDGSLLFVIYENVIQAFSVATGELARCYENKTNDGHLIGMVLDSSQKKFIYGCTVDGFILAWKIDSGLLTDRMAIVKGKIVVESFSVLYDQNGISSFLVYGTSSKQLFLQYSPHQKKVVEVVRHKLHVKFDKDTGKYATNVEENEHVGKNIRIVVAPGGYGLNYFAYIAQNRWYWVKLKPGIFVSSRQHAGNTEPVVLACHPIEPIVAVGDLRGRVVLYRNFLTSGTIVPEEYHWHKNPVNCLAFSSTGSHFYSGGNERVLVKWSVGEEQKTDLIPRVNDSLLNVAVGPENLKLALCTADNCIQIMNAFHKPTATIQSFSKISTNLPDAELFPAGLRVNPRTHAILMNGRIGCIQFFSTYTKSMLYTLDITMRNYNTDDCNVLHNTMVTNVGVNAHWLATVEIWDDYHNSMETRLKFWQYNESRQIYSLNTNLENVHQGGVCEVAFSSSSRERDLQCATAGKDRRIKVWSLVEVETTDGGERLVWICIGSVGHRNLPVRSISFSQDASLLAGGFGNVLCIWNPDTLKLKCALSAPSGYDGCVNRALLTVKSSDSKKQTPKKAAKQNTYENTRAKIIAEFVALMNGNGKSTLFDNATKKYTKQQSGRRMYSARLKLIENVSEDQKKFIVGKVQANSKLNMMQRAELFYTLRIACSTNAEIKSRIQNKLRASSRSVRIVEEYLKKICDNVSNTRRFPIIRKQRNYQRRRVRPVSFENGLGSVFAKENIDQIKTAAKREKVSKETENLRNGPLHPQKCFAQIQNVLFCYGKFSHLVVISTDNRFVVWNLLSLKIQVSAALTIDCIALDHATNLIAAFTKDKELYVFLPNIPMPLYHRSNMPKVFGAVWIPRRYPSSQSFNVDWQATSQLFFLNEKQELLQLVSDNDEETVGPIDSDDEEEIVEETANDNSLSLKTPFAAMIAKQTIGSGSKRNPTLRSGISSGMLGKSMVRDIVGSCSHTMTPINLLCKDFLRSLLVTEETRTKESKALEPTNNNTSATIKVVGAEINSDYLNGTADSANGDENGDNDEEDETTKQKITSRKAASIAVNQMKRNEAVAGTAASSSHLAKLSDEVIDVIF